MADHAPSGADLLFSSAEIGVGRRNRFVFLPIGRRSREDLVFRSVSRAASAERQSRSRCPGTLAVTAARRRIFR